MSSASQVYFLGISAPSAKTEDVIVMDMSDPPDERVAMMRKPRIEYD
jgi:hypothetical protein